MSDQREPVRAPGEWQHVSDPIRRIVEGWTKKEAAE